MAAPSPPTTEPVTATCWGRKLCLEKTFAENGITDGAKIVVECHAGNCPGWFNEAERMEVAMEGIKHHQKRTWARATAEATAAGFYPSGTLFGQRIPQPAGSGILWVGQMIGDNSIWQMAPMHNLTTEEAIARITISTQIDPPGTKIVLRRVQENEPTAQTTSTAIPTRTPADAAYTAAGDKVPPRTTSTSTAKDAWNQRQLSHAKSKENVPPLVLTPA